MTYIRCIVCTWPLVILPVGGQSVFMRPGIVVGKVARPGTRSGADKECQEKRYARTKGQVHEVVTRGMLLSFGCFLDFASP